MYGSIDESQWLIDEDEREMEGYDDANLSFQDQGVECKWKKYEKLLKEAVRKNHYFALQKLLDNEHLVDSIDEFKERCIKPLILAIGNKNVCLINLLCKHGYKLPDPHPRKCCCNNCNDNRYGQIKAQMAALKALCNPVWICVSADDPFATIFKLQTIEEEFERVNGSFTMEFEEIYKQNEQFCIALIDQIKSEREGLTLMRNKTIYTKSVCLGLDFINLAIAHGQKNIVSHSMIQYHLQSKVFSCIPQWDNRGIMYKIFITFLIAILAPVTSILNIVLPSSCCPSVSDFALRPYVKFVNGAVSFLTFIGLLITMGAAKRNGIRSSDTPTGVEIAVFVWVIGFCFGELRQIYKNGIRDYLSNGWNWVDIAMDFFMLVTYILWFVLYGLIQTNNIDQDNYKVAMFVADGTFCVAIVLSFFRLLYLCQANKHLGLVQICMGEMIMVIWQFMFVTILNLLGFTVAMVYLFHSSYQGRVNIDNIVEEYNDYTAIYVCFKEYFFNFFSTLFTLVYVSLGVADTSTLENFEDGTLIHLWGNIFFIVYIGVSMIILLNMLIAMMSTSYQLVADNIHTEHLYSQTRLWMEYVGPSQTRPIPFNMIPRLQTLIDAIKKPVETKRAQELEDFNYRRVCSALVKRYLRKVFGGPDFADPPEPDSHANNDLLMQKIELAFQDWKKASQPTCIQVTDDINLENDMGNGAITQIAAISV